MNLPTFLFLNYEKEKKFSYFFSEGQTFLLSFEISFEGKHVILLHNKMILSNLSDILLQTLICAVISGSKVEKAGWQWCDVYEVILVYSLSWRLLILETWGRRLEQRQDWYTLLQKLSMPLLRRGCPQKQ